MRKASDEKKLVCCGVRLAAPSTKTAGPPMAKKMAGMITITAPSMAQTWMKSVSTEARKPDHSV
ncbi:hypothetical protein D3C85_1893730 [compost metagenome]